MTKQEHLIVAQIASRAVELYSAHGVGLTRLDCMMDIEAVHETIGLKLEELLNADDGNFAHDIGGIDQHLNRETLELEDCFVPRFAS